MTWQPLSNSSDSSYLLPTASSTVLGGVKVGTGLSIDGNGVLSSTGSGTTTPTSNLILGGNVKFKVDFVAKTISYTTWNLFTTSQTFTLNAGTGTFTSQMGTSTVYYVCYKNNVIELVSAANIGTYTGYIIFVIMNTTVFPFSYPETQIGVNGGSIFSRSLNAVGSWHKVGDSITFDGAFDYILDEFNIPIVTTTAVSGKHMAGSGGMWADVSSIPTTTDLITIMGGTNDQSSWDANASFKGSLQPVGSTFDTNTYIGAYQTLIEGILNANPRATIILATPPRAWTDGTGTTERTSLKDIGSTVKDIGAFYSLPVIDTYNNAGINKITMKNPNVSTDGLHPQIWWKRRLSALMAGAIRQNYQFLS